MTPKQVRQEAEQAVKEQNCVQALRVCRALADPNLFIGFRAPTEAVFEGDLTRPLSHAGRCNVCGKTIARGVTAVWIKGMGVWHIPCYEG
jgi:hypothetical protein